MLGFVSIFRLTLLPDGPGHSALRPLSGIPVRAAPAAAISPMQVHPPRLFFFLFFNHVTSDPMPSPSFSLHVEVVHQATIKNAGKKDSPCRILTSLWCVLQIYCDGFVCLTSSLPLEDGRPSKDR